MVCHPQCAVADAAGNAGQAFQDNIVTPITNGANSAVQFVRDIPNNVRTAAGNTSAAANAIASGVPADDVSYWTGMLNSGRITPEQYNNYLNSQAQIYASRGEDDRRAGRVQDNSIGAQFDRNVATPLRNFGQSVVDTTVNGLNDLGQAVSNGYRDVTNTVATAGTANRARNAGVPQSTIDEANRLLSEGVYSPETYNNYLNNLAQIEENERAAARAGW